MSSKVLLLSIIFTIFVNNNFTHALSPTHINETKDNLNIREALNKAARQQTLTQRIAKVYLALNNNLYEPKFYQERDFAIETFQKELDELKWYTPTDKIKSSLENVKSLWEEYKKIASWSINKQGAEKLLSQCDKMLNASKSLASAYQEYAYQLGELYKSGDLVEIVQLIQETGTQRMLTQRLMLFYLAAKQDISKDESIRKLEVTTKEFDHAIKKLADAPINSESINKEIAEMGKYWTSLKQHLLYFKEDPNYINSMLLLSDELTNKAETMSILYQDLSKKLSVSRSINVVAYQNMLTQRIAKSYLAITYNFSVAKYKKELLTSIDLFEEQMKSMLSSAPNDEIKDAIKVVELMWQNYRKLATDWQDLSDIKTIKLLEKSHVIMASCDRVGQVIEDYAQTIPAYKAFYEKNGEEVENKNNIAKQVHLAGLQRVYSQRVAVYFMMNALNKDSNLSQDRLKDCLEQFQANHNQLDVFTLNTTPILNELNTCYKEWTTVVQLCTANKKDQIESMLEHSEHLFNKLDKLNGLYEKRMDELIAQ